MEEAGSLATLSSRISISQDEDDDEAQVVECQVDRTLPSMITPLSRRKRTAVSSASSKPESDPNVLSVLTSRAVDTEKLKKKLDDLISSNDVYKAEKQNWGIWFASCCIQVPADKWMFFRKKSLDLIMECVPPEGLAMSSDFPESSVGAPSHVSQSSVGAPSVSQSSEGAPSVSQSSEGAPSVSRSSVRVASASHSSTSQTTDNSQSRQPQPSTVSYTSMQPYQQYAPQSDQSYGQHSYGQQYLQQKQQSLGYDQQQSQYVQQQQQSGQLYGQRAASPMATTPSGQVGVGVGLPNPSPSGSLFSGMSTPLMPSSVDSSGAQGSGLFSPFTSLLEDGNNVP